MNCSLTQQVDDKNGGHACIACQGSIKHILDADVCLDSQGNAMSQPKNCAWGSNLTLGDGTVSPVAYDLDDCKPVSCKGTDHIDFGGHECMKCQNIMNVPLALLGGSGGGNGGGLQVIPMDGGKATVSGSNGNTYQVGHVEKDGAKYAEITGPDGKVQTTKGGGKGPMVQVCLDPPVTQPNYAPLKIPGLQIEREKPDLQYQDYKPPSAYYPGNLFGNKSTPGGDPGNNPIKPDLGNAIQGGAAATSARMAMPGRPVPPPPPGGGTGGTVPAQDDKGYSSHTVPAEGDGKSPPTSTGPGRTSKGKDNDKDKGSYTTVTVPAEPDAPTNTGPGRNSKGKNDGKTSGAPAGGYESFTLEGKDASAPNSTGPGRNSRGKDKGGYSSRTDPAKGDGTNGNVYKYDKDDGYVKPKDSGSSSGTPQPRPTPGLNKGPELRATPRLNDGAPLRATPGLNGGSQLRATPQVNPTPPAGRMPSTSSNTTQPAERTRPTLNDSRSGPTLSPGTGAPANPFGR